MKRMAFQIIFTAALVVVFAVGCEHDPTNVLTQSSDPTNFPNKAKDDPLTISPGDTIYSYMDLEFLDSLEYEEFSGNIPSNLGCGLMGEMETWPGGGDFTIFIHEGAVTSGYFPIEFSMRIPTYQSYMDHPELPLIIRLEPSDINFEIPVTVIGTYMPWTGVTVDDVFKYFCLTPVFKNYGKPTVFEIDRKVKMEFQAPHFSDWGVGNSADDRSRKPK